MARTAVKNRIKQQVAHHQRESIFDVLKSEHDKIKRMFTRLSAQPDQSEEIFTSIYTELESHMSGEEQLFYPELEPGQSLRELVLEAYEEHNLGKILLNELEGMSPGDERWKAKLKVLQEVVEHHIDEEEKGIFPKARKVLGKEREAQIAHQYLDEKPQLEEVPETGSPEEAEEF